MLLSCSLISNADTLCTPFSYSFRFCCRSFFNPSSFNPLAKHSAFSSATVMFLKGLIPPFLFVLPAGPAQNISIRSARDRCGDLKQYVKSQYLLKSPLQPLQPLLPPRCSPLSNCCSGPSPWKKCMTSVTGHPLLVTRLFCSSSKHWRLVSM